MRKILITRFAALGDHIHASHLPRLLKEKEGYDWVSVEYNLKGIPIYSHNPFIDEHIMIDPSRSVIRDYPISFLEKRHEWMKETMGFEKVIDLRNSIERGYLAMEDQNEYYLSTSERRKKYGGYNYYDRTTIAAGYPQHCGTFGEIYFSPEQEAVVGEIWNKEYKGRFVIIVNLSGSSKHKLFYNAENIIKTFLVKHPDAVCITMGDKSCKDNIEFTGERIINRAGVYPMKQSILMTSYTNLVIGCESGLMVAATLLGAPTVQLMTAASIKNHGGDFANDYSLQSPCKCSPCHKGPYEYIGCPTFTLEIPNRYSPGYKYPECIRFEKETVLDRMEQVYNIYRSNRNKKKELCVRQ